MLLAEHAMALRIVLVAAIAERGFGTGARVYRKTSASGTTHRGVAERGRCDHEMIRGVMRVRIDVMERHNRAVVVVRALVLATGALAGCASSVSLADGAT